jgi:hypothetical protein
VAAAVRLREDYSAQALRALARRSKEANQSRRLLSLAAVGAGMDRGSAAKIGGMDRQTLRLGASFQRVRSGWTDRQLDRRPEASTFQPTIE